MPGAQQFISDIYVNVNGQRLPDQQRGRISSITVEQNLYLPDACTIVFLDTGLARSPQDPLMFGLADQNILPIGAEIEIGMGRDQDARKVFKGEVTAHDVDMPPDAGARLIVRGYNRAHRLQRGRFSRSFLKVTYSDIVKKLAQESGFQSQVTPTSEVYPFVLQNNQTNWEFLQDLAARTGYEFTVDGTTLRFAPSRAKDSPVQELELRKDVYWAQVRLSSVGQVDDVTVSSWDSMKKQPITGRASNGTATAHLAQQKVGADLSKRFGTAHMTVARHSAQSQAEADTLAQALVDDLTGNSIHLDAEIKGNPDLHPGQVVSLKEFGDRFSGQYYITSAKHHMGIKSAYTTTFTLGGRRSGALLELLKGPAQRDGHGVGSAMAVGIVTNNKDDQNLGRVKVKLPWLGDGSIETDWARIAAPSAGGTRGFYWLPEVNDEVLVAFEHGDPQRAYVIGVLWNGQDKPPKGNADAVDGTGKVTQRIIQSRSGHVVLLDDTDNKGKVSITSSSGHTITLDDASGGQKITIADNTKNNLITIDTQSNKITLSAQGDLELKATGNVKVSGMAISVEAQSNCDIKANANASFQANANLDLKANANAKVSGAMASVEAQGICSVKGSMVQLN